MAFCLRMRTASLLTVAVLGAVDASSSCDVSTRGAKGDGKSNDAKAIQATLDDPACAEVVFSGERTYMSGELKISRSNLVITFTNGTTLKGEATQIKQKQCEDVADWQNWCAFVTVQSERNVTLRGHGVLDASSSRGSKYSAIHVKSTSGVNLGGGMRIHCTNSWWCSVMHNASDVHVAGLFIDAKTGRDGLDLVNVQRVLIEDSRIEGSDDGLCFKTQADAGLGAFPSLDITVRRCYLSSECCNAIQFGSRTEVDMRNITFEDIVIGSGRKSAIGIVSMDSANISQLMFRNVSIHGHQIATPLFLKLGNRQTDEYGHHRGNWPIGSLSNISFDNITAWNWGHAKNSKKKLRRSSYTATIEGLSSSNRVEKISIRGFSITAPGGGSSKDIHIDPPIAGDKYQPRYNGVRPSWGWFVRHAEDVTFSDCSLNVAGKDGRPAMIMDDVVGAMWNGGHVSAGDGCQLMLRNVSGSDLNGTALHSCEWTPKDLHETFELFI
eukprot:gnl/MRDRNA2_/MRDRNA2_86521_c1_seq3.p1 gnl/MRDRNA2_/MRDRNA2_86521_c1~~gnl/MRDRNA2_/MRDRNA2_86521_c1_seq3.p1  ORF type:complete len:496 (+),score=56.55 gnl/MRDRNA2_/MRDRNA2_86521_c1_seq3:75-1562(+)